MRDGSSGCRGAGERPAGSEGSEHSRDPLCVGGMLLGTEKIQCGLSCTEIHTNVEKYPKDQSFTLISSGLICWAYL